MNQFPDRSTLSATPSYLTREREATPQIPNSARRLGNQIVLFRGNAKTSNDLRREIEFPAVFSSQGRHEFSRLQNYRDVHPVFKRHNPDLKITRIREAQLLNSAEEIPPTAMTPLPIT